MNEHPEVQRYVKRLENALRDVPRERRREIVGEVAAHIDQALGERREQPSDYEVDDVLEQLGDPESIAAEEVGGAAQGRRWGVIEVAALILLPIGAFVLPLIGWIIGVVLLWVSSVWTTRDKVIGTLVVPGGLAFPFYFMLFAGGVRESCSGGVSFRVFEDGRRQRIEDPLICESSGGFGDPFFTAILILLVVATIGSVVYLAHRMKRPPLATQ